MVVSSQQCQMHCNQDRQGQDEEQVQVHELWNGRRNRTGMGEDQHGGEEQQEGISEGRHATGGDSANEDRVRELTTQIAVLQRELQLEVQGGENPVTED